MGLCTINPQTHLTKSRDYQIAALAPFPAPRLRAAPWNANRPPLKAAAHVHYYANLARRIAALTDPPTRPAVANLSLNRNIALADQVRLADRQSVIIPAPVHLISVASTYILSGTSGGVAYVEIPELDYRRHIDLGITTGTEVNMLTPLNLDRDKPVTLVIGYEAVNTSGAAQTLLTIISASLSYRPIAP